MREIIDIEYSEFFEVGDKVNLGNKVGVVVQTYNLDENNFVIGGKLIICWYSPIEHDLQIISKSQESYLIKIDNSYKFKYIDNYGN